MSRKLRKAAKIGMITTGRTLDEKLRKAKASGFDGVELDHPGPYSASVAREATARTGVVIPGVVDAVHWTMPLSDPDLHVRATGLARLVQALDYAAAVGAGGVLLVPGVVSETVSFDECWHRSSEQVRTAARLAERAGVDVLIENVWNDFLTDPVTMAEYVDSFRSKHVGVHFDVGNAVRYSPPEDWIAVLGRRIRNVDVKDFATSGGQFDVPLFEGDVVWPSVMAALDDIGYQGWLSAELDATEEPGWLLDVADRMNRIIAA